MTLHRILDIPENKKALFLLTLFFAAFIFRGPTLFNDFYASDELAAIVQAKEYLAGEVPGRDFMESKKPLYHLVFKGSYAISHDHGWVYVHLFTILTVFFTSLFIYLTARDIYGHRQGVLAAFLYSIMISSFNAEFMATNGEVLYNLPVAAGFFFFTRILKRRGPLSINLPLALLMCVAAYQVKFHGLILGIFILIFLVAYYPYWRGMPGKYYAATALAAAAAVLAFRFMFPHLAGTLWFQVTDKLYYAMAPDRGFTILHFVSRFIYRHGIFFLWHMVLWVPAALFLARFIRKRLRLPSIEESSLALFFIVTYMIVLGGGARLYYHYFMASYPALCIIAPSVLLNAGPGFIKKRLLPFILAPGLFFLGWNVKDVILRNFFPAGFYNEGPVLFWTRAVIMGTYNNYLLPSPVYTGTVAEIKRLTRPGDRIFVWGHGPDIYYFSDRRLGNYTLWAKDPIFLIKDLYQKGDDASIGRALEHEESFIDIMELKKPVAFIDTSSSQGLRIFQTRLIDQAQFRVSPAVTRNLFPYLLKNYEVASEANDMKIYLRKGYRKER